jgi:WD40 repeat protein
VDSGRELRRFDEEGSCYQIAFSADGKHLLSCAGAGTIRLRDVDTGRELLSFQIHQHMVVGVALSIDGRRILTADHEGPICLWDATTGRELHHFEGHPGGALGVAFAPDGRTAASGGKDGIVRLWRLPDPSPPD